MSLSFLQSKHFKAILSLFVMLLAFVSMTAFAAWSGPTSASDNRAPFLNLGPVTQTKTGRLNITAGNQVLGSAKFEVAGPAMLAGGLNAAGNGSNTSALVLGDVYVGYVGSPSSAPTDNPAGSHAYDLYGDVTVSHDIKAQNLAHGNAGDLEAVCTTEGGWLIPCVADVSEPEMLARAVCYYRNPNTQQQEFATLPGTDCPDCTNTQFAAPQDAIDGQINMHIIGAGGHGSSYTQSVGEGIVIGGIDFDVTQGGLGAVISATNLPQDVDFETDYSDRWSVYARAGDAGGTGGLITLNGVNVVPSENFIVTVPPYNANFTTLNPDFSLNHLLNWQSPPAIPDSSSFVTPQYAPSSVGNVLGFDIRNQTPQSLVAPTQVIRQSTNETASAPVGTRAQSFEGWIDEPVVNNTALIEPPTTAACGVALGGVTGSPLPMTFNASSYTNTSLSRQLSPTQGPIDCAFKDFRFLPPVNAWAEDAWTALTPSNGGVAQVSSNYGQSSNLGGPSLNPDLQVLIPYTPGLGGSGGRLSASQGPLPGDPGNLGAVCFEWQEE